MFLIIIGVILLLIALMGLKDPTLVRFRRIGAIVGVILIIVGLFSSVVKQIDSGHVGVQVLFGQVQQSTLQEGLNLVNPLVEVKQMSLQTQNYTMSATSLEGAVQGDDAIRVLSMDGLEVVIDLTVLYKIIPYKAPDIYRELGLSFEDKIIRPITRTGIREGAAQFDAISLFSEKREKFEVIIRAKIEKELKARGVNLEQLLVRNITLPASVKESIERKITAIQDAQRMEFVLQKEKQEAERKRVEAQGVADAQKIVNLGLSDKILQFEMIKVQKELATSPNSKIIIMGGGKSSPPFIIGQ
jgi:regulator of protease activity HflC (stomatin/prohibitin superfamily)